MQPASAQEAAGQRPMKLRQKMGPIATVCQEIASGIWRFETNQFWWEWREVQGLNLSCRDKDVEGETFTPVLWAKTLNDAVMFGCGYDGGFGYAQRIAAKEGK